MLLDSLAVYLVLCKKERFVRAVVAIVLEYIAGKATGGHVMARPLARCVAYMQPIVFR